jgi:hypothetical protein
MAPPPFADSLAGLPAIPLASGLAGCSCGKMQGGVHAMTYGVKTRES